MCKSLFVLPATLLVAACSPQVPENTATTQPATFAGSHQCASCHQPEFELWRGSDHELAMQVANEESVLADFSGQTLSYFETETSFFERDGGFFVRTQNATGVDEEFEITHTFGVEPLQQYLVDLPGGRKQALQFAWDARPDAEGGQRWYHLYPDEYVGPDDPLHWTGRYFNWNVMCAECHSTNVQLGYDVESNTFDTTFDEISVGCEACHGPGSLHIAQATAESFDGNLGLLVDLDDHANSAWVMNAATGIAERTAPNSSRQQPESCGRCHSRRSVISSEYEFGASLTDTHMPSSLEENLYHADGRIQDEVYVYGSFIQSKMHAAGVTCSDCHNPHSGELLAGPNPNDTCAQCHLPTVFASTQHSGTDTGDCVGCHMKATLYMGVDGRRDHSFRLPDTETDPEHYGQVIAAGRGGGANSELLNGITNQSFPPVARATMLTLLEPARGEAGSPLVLAQLDSPEPLIRIAALRALRQQAVEIPVQASSHLLRDAVRGVRIEAALTFVEYRDLLPLEDTRAFPIAADEYRQAMLANISMPDAALNLAEFESRLGNPAEASKMYEHALRIGPDFAPAHHAYGLYLVRAARQDAALERLRRAAELEPDNARYSYVYGVALNSLGQPDDAIVVLTDAHRKFRDDYDIAWALATMLRDSGDRMAAREIAQKLSQQFPGDERVGTLLQALTP